jgi:transglutaminase-like putative cysteine protease
MGKTVNPARPADSPGDFLWWVLRAQWACGLLLLAVLTEVSRAALLASGTAFLAGAALDRAGTSREGLRRLTLPLVALAVAGAGADLFLGSRDLLFAVSVLVLGIQAIKFLLPKNARDGWQLCAVSFLEFLAAAATTAEIQFAAFTLLYIGLCAGAMWALQIAQREEERDGTGSSPPARPRFAAKLLLFTTVGGFLLTAILFAVTPRIGIGQILRRLGRGEGLTGFSDTISLRDVTGVKADRRIVARVEFTELPPGTSPLLLYLRGAVYSRFDGTTWKRPGGDRRRVPRSGFTYVVASPPPGVRLSTAEITLESMENPALFVYENPFLFEGSLGEIWTGEGGGFSLSQPGHAALRYRLQFSPKEQHSSRPGPKKESGYLELPPGGEDLRGFAARVAAEGRTDAERAELMLRHFRTGYRYTIVDPASSLREFLFAKRAGFCEHYATALALLLRAAGIPARVAAGYLGGEWSDVGNYLIVRQSDAHAWTEAWIDGGWVTLDATPPLGEHSPFFAKTGKVGFYVDWARQRWNKYVVNYSLKMQAESVSEGWAALRRARAVMSRGFAPGGDLRRRAGFLTAALLPSFLLAAFLWRVLGGRESRNGPDSVRGRGDARAPRPYARLLRRLAACGYRSSPGTTFEEMLHRASRRKPDLSAAASRFLALYHRDRFGAFPLPPDEFREAARLAGRLGREIAHSGER